MRGLYPFLPAGRLAVGARVIIVGPADHVAPVQRRPVDDARRIGAPGHSGRAEAQRDQRVRALLALDQDHGAGRRLELEQVVERARTLGPLLVFDCRVPRTHALRAVALVPAPHRRP